MITPRNPVRTAAQAAALTFLGQEQHRQHGDEQRARVVKRHSGRQRQACKCDVKAEIGHEHHKAAQNHLWRARREQGADAAVKMCESQQERDRGEAADQHRLIQRIAARNQLQDQVLHRKHRDSGDQVDDTERGGFVGHSGKLGGCAAPAVRFATWFDQNSGSLRWLRSRTKTG